MSTARRTSRTPMVRPLPGPPDDEAQPPREQFIPLRKSELVESLARTEGLTAAQSQQFRYLCRLIEGLIHRQFHQALDELKNAYAPFDPDSDTSSPRQLLPAETDDHRQTLFRKFGWLMQRGNFVRLAQDVLDEAMNDCSHWGLNLAINFQVFDRLEIYARGSASTTRQRRRLANWYRPEDVELPIYQRLAVIFRLKPDSELAEAMGADDVYLKLFKDIPKMDLEMLLPGTQVRMSHFDRARIMLPTLSGVSIALFKVISPIMVAGVAGAPNSLGSLMLAGGTMGYGARSFFGYRNTKQKYQLNLTQSLYYLNLDNNAGAIHRLLDEAEEQENREAILAYFHLWRDSPAEGRTAAELDAQIEASLLDQTGLAIDFEVPDALAKLERLSILEPVADNRWRAVPMQRAVEILERQWRSPPE